MPCNEENAKSLLGFCKKLHAIARNIENTKLYNDDHLGFMSLCFLSRQLDHMNAIFKLYPHTDIQLLSRTMIEGLNQLLWCFKYPDKALQWRAYAWISDWRLTKSLQEEGKEVPITHIKAIEKALETYGEQFKKKKSSNGDPYHSNWRCGVSLKEISSEVKGEAIHKHIYSPYSDWQHWGVSSIGEFINNKDNKISYNSNRSENRICGSLATAFLCLYQILEVVENHHKVGISDRLTNIHNQYVNHHEKSQ